MMITPILALCGLALADEPARATAALYPSAIEMVTDAIAGEVLSFESERLSAPVNCFDEVGVTDFSLDIPIDRVIVTPSDGRVDVRIELGEVRGEGWGIYATDAEDDGDDCTSFEGDLDWITLQNGGVEGAFALSAADGQIVVELAEDPVFFGDLDMDIVWAPEWAEGWGWDLFPDDLVLDLFEEDVIDLLGERSAEYLSTLLAENVGEASFESTLGSLGVAFSVEEMTTTPAAISAAAAVDLSWEGIHACQPEDPALTWEGSAPTLALAQRGEELLGLGATEALLNQFAVQLWADGLLCMTPGDVDDLLGGLLPDLGASSISGMLRLDRPPVITLLPDVVGLVTENVQIELIGRDGDERITLLALEADVAATASLALDADLASLTISLLRMDLDVDVSETEHLLEGGPEAREELEAFLSDWLPELAVQKVQNLPVLGTVLWTDTHAVRLEHLLLETGSVTGGVGLVSREDPRADQIAPEAIATLASIDATHARVVFSAEDDRDGPIAYRHRLGEGTWSIWSLEDVIEIAVTPGQRIVLELAARDAWLNEDPRPARLVLEAPVPLGGPALGCGALPGVDGMSRLDGAPGASGLPATLTLMVSALIARRRSTIGTAAPVSADPPRRSS